MALYCAACPTTSILEPEISFHKFPENCLKEVWLEKMQKQAMMVTENTVLCSKHFVENDYVNLANKKRKLIADAVPSIFPWTEVLHVGKRSKKKNAQINPCTRSSIISNRFGFSMEMIRNNDELVELFTGFKNYNHLNSTFCFLLPVSRNNDDDFINDFNANSEVLLEADCSISAYRTVVSPEDKFLMTLMKFRLGLATADLAFRFNVSRQLASTILTTWINYMYNRFNRFMIWPPRCALLSNLPKEFVSYYPGVIAVIAAVQLPIDGSRNSISENINFTNCRCLIVCDPNGAILFTSQMYKKDISYKDLAQQCGLLDLLKMLAENGYLEKDDIILLDSAIDINDDLKALDLQSKYYEKLNDADDAWPVNRSLAAIKRFSFFDGRPIPLEMLDLLDQMWTSVCFLTSLFPLHDETSTKLLL